MVYFVHKNLLELQVIISHYHSMHTKYTITITKIRIHIAPVGFEIDGIPVHDRLQLQDQNNQELK